MKTVVAVILAAALSFAVAYGFASNRRAAEFAAEKAAMEANWAKSRQALEDDLRAARTRAPRVEEITREVEVQAAPARQDPQALIDKLITLKPDAKTDMTTRQRQIVHQFEGLIDLGPNALPAIEAFLKLNQDVAFSRPPRPRSENMTEQQQAEAERRQESRDRWEEIRRSTRMRLPDGDFTNPPSVRLGLMEAAFRIGGDEAERILAETLHSAVRGYEVAWLTAWLEDMAKGKYRDLATAVAKDLLLNPVAIPGGSREDQFATSHLYTVLEYFNDATFTDDARKLLVTADGRLDQTAVAYLKSTLKENAVPVLLSAYNDPRLTSSTDKGRILGISQPYFGSHPQADELFRNLMLSGDKADVRNKYYAVAGLDGGGFSTDGRAPVPKDPQVIQRRLALLESVKEVEMDKRTLDMMERTYKNLQKLANGEKLDDGRGRSRERR